MQLNIQFTKRHFYTMIVFMVLMTTTIFVYAYGSSSPTVFGHSAGELVVDSSSIIDGSIVGEDINISTLNGTATALTAGDLNCTDCISNTEVDAATFSLSCTETTTVLSSGTGIQSFDMTITAGFTIVSGSCSEGAQGRFVTQSRAIGSDVWRCSSDDGTSTITAGLAGYARGCKIA